MSPRDLAEQLVGEEHQPLFLGPLICAHVGDEERCRCSHGSAVGVVRGVIDDVAQQVDADFRIDREGDAEPDSVSEGDERVSLVALVKHIAGVGRVFPVLLRSEEVKRGARQWPGLFAALQRRMCASHLQQDAGAFGRWCIFRQAAEFMLQLDEMPLELRFLPEVLAQ